MEVQELITQSVFWIGWIRKIYWLPVGTSDSGACHFIPPTNSSPRTYLTPVLVQLRTEAEPCNASSFDLTVTTVRVGI